MSMLQALNVAIAFGIVLVTSALNLLKRQRESLQLRFGVLGLTLAGGIAAYFAFAYYGVPFGSTQIAILAFFAWSCGFFYVSFLIDLTSAKRLAAFPLLMILPFALAGLAAIVPRPIGIVAMTAAGTLILSWCTLYFLISWLSAATDDRARRDGEWVLMVFVAFGVGLVVCLSRSMAGIFWVLSIWYVVTHIVINYLNIRNQLSDPENQLIIDNIFDLLLLLDAQGRIARVNRRTVQLTEFSPSALHGYGLEKIAIHPGLSGSRRAEWLAQYSWFDTGIGSQRSPSFDSYITTSKGEEIPVDMRIIRLVDLRKVTTGYIVSATDMRITRQLMKEISDREYAARDLALSESKFSRMFIFNPTGILIVDLENLWITDANPAIEEILDCESSALLGKTLNDIGVVMEGMTVDEFIEKLKQEGSVPEFSGTIRLPSRQERKCRLSAVSFELNNTRRLLLSVADVTQQEVMREALERKQKVETVGALAGGIAHDFNNILAVILGHVGLAKMRVVDPHARAPIEKAEQACLRAREMTQQLLTFSRGGNPVFGIFNPRQIIIDSAMLAVSDTAVACLFDIDRALWDVRADKMQLGQVVTNLVGNAVHAMEKSGIIEVQGKNVDLTNVSPSHRPTGLDSRPLPGTHYIELRFKDQGPGIPDSIRDKIFDPFFTTREKGTGLGLSVVFSVVQNHGGAIELLSPPGEGATFILFLPAIGTSSGPAPTAEDAPLTGHKRVLLMDDDPAVREVCQGLLASLGYDVVSTVEGGEAVEEYRRSRASDRPFDFCILDLIVPEGMPGTECAKQILAFDPNAVLLVSSGYSDDPVLSHYQEYGFKGIIPKPYTIEELRAAIGKKLVN